MEVFHERERRSAVVESVSTSHPGFHGDSTLQQQVENFESVRFSQAWRGAFPEEVSGSWLKSPRVAPQGVSACSESVFMLKRHQAVFRSNPFYNYSSERCHIKTVSDRFLTFSTFVLKDSSDFTADKDF